MLGSMRFCSGARGWFRSVLILLRAVVLSFCSVVLGALSCCMATSDSVRLCSISFGFLLVPSGCVLALFGDVRLRFVPFGSVPFDSIPTFSRPFVPVDC